MVKQHHEGYGKRLLETTTAVFLYPHLPDGKQWEYMVASWVVLIPMLTIAGMFLAVKLVNMFLVSAGMTPPHPHPTAKTA